MTNFRPKCTSCNDLLEALVDDDLCPTCAAELDAELEVAALTGSDWSLLDQLPWLGVPIWYRAATEAAIDSSRSLRAAVNVDLMSAEAAAVWRAGMAAAAGMRVAS